MSKFELILFSTHPQIINQAMKGGLGKVIVDLENQGKYKRQLGFDTEINYNTFSDIRTLRKETDAWVITRINGFSNQTANEINQSINHGTHEILLPMVQSISQVEEALAIIKNRCKLGILVETVNGLNISKALAKLPLSRVYVGLNDLAIDRGKNNIFVSVADGTVETIRPHFHLPFGFGGLTLPEAGHPIPCRLLISEYARLKTQFSFLRRSFFRDTQGKDLSEAVTIIQKAVDAAFNKSEAELEKDHLEFLNLVEQHTANQD
jgi:hypothetical protein